MFSKTIIAGALALGLLSSFNFAYAHAIAGNRVFPVTLGVDDPGVADEVQLPVIYHTYNSDNSQTTGVNFEFSKTITQNFGLIVGNTWVKDHPGGDGMLGYYTNAKYRFFLNPEHEFMMSAGVVVNWGHSGNKNLAEYLPYTSVAPNLYFGKGFGDLPTNLNILRPLALTGQIGYAIPTDKGPVLAPNPSILNWGLSLQYSLPYLNANVHAIEGPNFLKGLIPVVEVAMQTPLANTLRGTGSNTRQTTGTINYGLIYMGQSYQVAAEATVPVNHASGNHVGFIVQAHFFLDDIFPNTLGKPLFQ